MVKPYLYDSHDLLRSHLADLLDAYNYTRRLKVLGGLKPYKYIARSELQNWIGSLSIRSSKSRD